ncbi:demethoxyubiquinone hydroxylase family protein [Pseudoxanthomonas sacheonensis]|uniref:Ubiquinone biosynthesis monooxygenase Coq7 n=1 Tax=Pseudoxanthomonas sacheonensis TaxID=443615 RepID=A0ABU1RNC6_9GAMM|nr:demethoxyubiquinone hydroxylase family protein [Pseudoxanthomonas sacheonensis]MDR6840279.1 ubiquinone biosynthesis monooxygenase Coq7 [Pseudoxanthomonas sacheonensis]
MIQALGDRILKVDHAGEHGAVNIYRAQILVSRITAPELTATLREFIAHEQRHRALFWNRMQSRAVRRCRSYPLCGLGGYLLGFLTALLGRQAIAATTFAVESVVLGHLEEQLLVLKDGDPEAYATVLDIVEEEREHHDHGKRLMEAGRFWPWLITPVVRFSTETVIWLGMRL